MSEIEPHYIKTERTARFFTLKGEPDAPEYIWFVLHGYGQLANYFIRKFAVLAERGHQAIAPEGLSRFYLSGTSGRVGASWMTKESRLDEIEDYVAYLDKLYDSLLPSFSPSAKIILLGFSQGVATAWRWAQSGKIKPAELVLWAGNISYEEPPDTGGIARPMGLHVVRGLRDPYISRENENQLRQKVSGYFPEANFYHFEGKHEIDTDTLLRLALKFENKSE